MKYVKHLQDFNLFDKGWDSYYPIAHRMGFRYVRMKKDGTVWRAFNPLFYKQEEINKEEFKIIE